MYSYEERTQAEAPKPGECYCHLTMHVEHYSKRPCHFCEEEMRREWPECFATEVIEAEEPPTPKPTPAIPIGIQIEISPLEVIELERLSA